MSEIRVKDGESLESALRRFKRSTARSGVLAEVRKREAYEKPSVRRKKKSEAARKRKYKYAAAPVIRQKTRHASGRAQKGPPVFAFQTTKEGVGPCSSHRNISLPASAASPRPF